MNIAISTDKGQVSPHFGRCPQFTILEVEENKVIGKKVIENPGHHPGFLPRFLSDREVRYIIAGGMGTRAQQLFKVEGIDVILGIQGQIEEVVKKFLKGGLVGGQSICNPGKGKGYGINKTECDHKEDISCQEQTEQGKAAKSKEKD